MQPSYKTIADFRKDNAKALKSVFRKFNQICLELELFGRELVAVDGSKFRAQNSMKNNFNQAKIDRHIEYIDKKLDEYLEQVDQQDELEEGQEQSLDLDSINKRVETLLERRFKYEQLEKRLEDSEERQISTTDADARALPLNKGIVEVSYNTQIVVDDKHCLITNYEVSNEKDSYALSGLAIEAKAVLEAKELEALADKGFHTGAALKECADGDIVTYVAPREFNHRNKEIAFQKSQFEYDREADHYTCPEGHKMITNGRWYEKNKGKGRRSYRIKRYCLPHKVCNGCPVKDRCVGAGTLRQRQGKAIERSEYEDYLIANAERVKAEKEKYRRRQAIVEHPFGTIKRAWGYTYTLLKGKEKVSGEFALIFTCYNLRRGLSILGVKGLLKWLKSHFWPILVLRASISAMSGLKLRLGCGAWWCT